MGCSMASVDDRCTVGADVPLQPEGGLLLAELCAPSPKILEYDTPPMLL